MTVRVSLKKGVREDPGWQAWVLARPGLATWASTERAVLARLPDKLASTMIGSVPTARRRAPGGLPFASWSGSRVTRSCLAVT